MKWREEASLRLGSHFFPPAVEKINSPALLLWLKDTGGFCVNISLTTLRSSRQYDYVTIEALEKIPRITICFLL